MKRLVLLGCMALLMAAPLAACGKKGDPDSEPSRVKLQMPPPNPPPAQPPAQQPQQQQPVQ